MKSSSVGPTAASDKRLRLAEGTATGGLLLICVSLVVPFFAPSDFGLASALKWIYAAGAIIYTVARVVGAKVPGDSLRLRRLRRMEFWAGVAFMIGGAFWFYSENHLGPYAGMLALLRETILFTLVGAAIQVIASWMIVSKSKSEARSASAGEPDKMNRKGERR
ncbi:MAG: hypothetical protein HDS48_01520 [Bacteroides sp.]|nr:hypothetical protein [Bacteroides sp.]MDE6077090.1 hypothetical protein [Muribaculaceae bacterium]MDE6424052.1 hypothetical protein [Muribaculaceae bacterium]